MIDFPVWLAFALLSPLCWAFVHVLDAYCVNEVFDFPWIGCITSAVATLCVYPFLLLGGVLFIDFQSIALSVNTMAIGSGIVFMFSQFLYFKSLSHSESGIVAAYWNMLPLFLPVFSYFIFGEVLSSTAYIGIGLLIISSVSFCLLDSNIEYRWRSFGMMFCAVQLQVLYFLAQKQVFESSPVYQAFLYTLLGVMVAGFFPLVTTRVRSAVKLNLPAIRTAFKFIILIEVINLVALATSLYAISYGSPSLVAAVEASLPAYCFCVSLSLFIVFRKYGEIEARERLPLKLLLTVIMATGVWLVSRYS